MKKPIGENFNEIMTSSVRNEITRAFNSIDKDLLYANKEITEEILNTYTEQAKKMVQCYIESQRTTILRIRTLI